MPMSSALFDSTNACPAPVAPLLPRAHLGLGGGFTTLHPLAFNSSFLFCAGFCTRPPPPACTTEPAPPNRAPPSSSSPACLLSLLLPSPPPSPPRARQIHGPFSCVIGLTSAAALAWCGAGAGAMWENRKRRKKKRPRLKHSMACHPSRGSSSTNYMDFAPCVVSRPPLWTRSTYVYGQKTQKRHRNGGDVQLTCTRPCRTIQDRRGAGHWETAAARLASWLTFLREPGVASLAPALGDACGKGFTFCIRCRKHCAMSLHDFRLAGRMVGGVQLLGIVRRRYRSFSVCAGAGKHGQVSQGRPDDEADGQDDDGGDDMGSTTVIRVASALGESGDTAGGAAVFGV